MQMVKGGLKAIYCSGWQVAADANAAAQVSCSITRLSFSCFSCMLFRSARSQCSKMPGSCSNQLAGKAPYLKSMTVDSHVTSLLQVYPDQSLYPANSVPAHVKRINNALQRGDQIEHAEGGAKKDWYVPIVADAEAGFGGPLNCFELMKAMIEAGAAGVHFEDQLASEKKCGHLGGKLCPLPLRLSILLCCLCPHAILFWFLTCNFFCCQSAILILLMCCTQRIDLTCPYMHTADSLAWPHCTLQLKQ